MAETITEWQKRQFNDNVHQVYIASATMIDSLIDASMVHNPVQGVLDDFDVIGNTVARDKVDRYENTIWGDVEKSRRWCRPYPSYLALPLDRMDKVRSAISDINSIHTKAIVNALRLSELVRFFAAAVGTAMTGETATGTAALPTAQIIALGTTPNDVLTLTKIKSASANFDVNAVPVGPSRRRWAFAPGQKAAILAITQAASSDFTNNKIYDRGNIDGLEWMGFFWQMFADVRSQGAPATPGATTLSTIQRVLPLTTTDRSNVVWSPDAIGISRCENLMTRLDELPQRTYTWQAYGEVDVNAVRVLDGGVMLVHALEE